MSLPGELARLAAKLTVNTGGVAWSASATGLPHSEMATEALCLMRVRCGRERGLGERDLGIGRSWGEAEAEGAALRLVWTG